MKVMIWKVTSYIAFGPRWKNCIKDGDDDSAKASTVISEQMPF